MNEEDFEIDQDIIFKLDENGKDELAIIIKPKSVAGFLKALIWDSQEIHKDPGKNYYYRIYGGNFSEKSAEVDQGKLFEWAGIRKNPGKDQLTMIAPTECMLKFFSCIVHYYQEDPTDRDSNYYFKYRGKFFDFIPTPLSD